MDAERSLLRASLIRLEAESSGKYSYQKVPLWGEAAPKRTVSKTRTRIVDMGKERVGRIERAAWRHTRDHV